MSTTDHPLKVLVQQFSRDFAEWLLETEVQSVELVNSDEAKLQALIANLALASSFDAVLANLPNGAESPGV